MYKLSKKHILKKNSLLLTDNQIICLIGLTPYILFSLKSNYCFIISINGIIYHIFRTRLTRINDIFINFLLIIKLNYLTSHSIIKYLTFLGFIFFCTNLFLKSTIKSGLLHLIFVQLLSFYCISLHEDLIK